jgi:hypothetical protein
MPTWAWIIIGIAAVGAITLVAAGYWWRGKRTERRRAEARVLRQEAEDRSRRAEERDALAEDLAKRAREEREHAEKLADRAGKLDPDSGSARKDDGGRDRDRGRGRRRQRHRSR